MKKTEREKMLAKELYMARDPELEAMMEKAQELLFIFNSTQPKEKATRREIIKSLFGSIKGNFEIVPPFHCDYGYHIYAQENLHINYDYVILDCNRPLA
ncbi:MAG: hypothetical protein HC916_15685 [Coleofasciculaceae cyanobacterium SM2_1_6]|nr:hypothetical protein [Coleofasciculaceae cyanobacterium SM2_1_6]